MMKRLCNFMFGGHSECKNTIHLYETQTTELLNQIQELKAMNHYQAYDLEKKITELEAKITELEAEIAELKKEPTNG